MMFLNCICFNCISRLSLFDKVLSTQNYFFLQKWFVQPILNTAFGENLYSNVNFYLHPIL